MATAAQVEQFRQGYDEVEQLVRRDLRRIWTGLRGATPETIRDVLLDLTPRLTDQYGAVAASMAAEWFEAVTGQAAQMADVTVTAAVQQSVRSGASGLWRDQQEAAFTNISSRLVRHSLQPGRLTIAGSASRHGLRYARAPEMGACAWCLMLASRGAVYGSADEARFVFRGAGAGNQPLGSKYHDDCVVGDTRVSGPATERGLRRYFEGEVVTLVTAMGHELTVTPNHPVLTDRGWVPAGMLDEGDNLVSSPRVDGAVVGGPDEDQVPARIEDFVRALGMVGAPVRRRVPTSSEEFHGDGFDSEVHVVDVNDLLRDEGHAALVEPFPELVFEMATGSGPIRRLSGDGSSPGQLGLAALLLPAPRVVRGSGEGFPLCGRHALHADPALLRGRTTFDASLSEPSVYDEALDVVRLGQGEDRLALAVPTGKVGRDGIAGHATVRVSRKFDPQTLYTAPGGLRAYADRGRGLLHRLAGSVELDRLVHKSVSDFAGHVYNLETVEGWYNANGITVSNCRCVPEPVRDDSELSYDAGALYDRYRSAWSDGADDRTVASKMRDLYGLP